MVFKAERSLIRVVNIRVVSHQGGPHPGGLLSGSSMLSAPISAPLFMYPFICFNIVIGSVFNK